MSIHKGILKGSVKGIIHDVESILDCHSCIEDLNKLNIDKLTIAKGLIEEILKDLK